MKGLLTMAAGGAALAGFAALAALAVLVLVVIPGGLGILTLEYKRVTRWWRRVRVFLVRTGPESKPEVL